MIAGGLYKGHVKGKVKLHPKVNQVVDMGAEAAIGVGIGNLLNAILDPPDTPAPVAQSQIRVVQPSNAMPEMMNMEINHNPFEVR